MGNLLSFVVSNALWEPLPALWLCLRGGREFFLFLNFGEPKLFSSILIVTNKLPSNLESDLTYTCVCVLPRFVLFVRFTQFACDPHAMVAHIYRDRTALIILIVKFDVAKAIPILLAFNSIRLA